MQDPYYVSLNEEDYIKRIKKGSIMTGILGDIKSGVGKSVIATHEISRGAGGSGNNMHGYTVETTNADEVRLRNEAKLEAARANLQNMKAQQLNQQGNQNQLQGVQKQDKGKSMIATGMALAGTLVGGWGGAAMVAAGMGMVMTGQQQHGQGQGQIAQVPPTEQAAVQHLGVSDQKNSEADIARARQPLETNQTEEEGASDNPADGTYAAFQKDDVLGADSISEEELAMLEELGTSSEELQTLMKEIESNASPENLALYKELLEGNSDEDISLITNDFLNSDFAEGLSTENYIEKFLDYALGTDDDAEALKPDETAELVSAKVDGTVDETNTLIDVGGTVSREGLDSIRASLYGGTNHS